MSRRTTGWSFEDASLGRSFLWSLAITSLPVVSGFIVSWIVARFAGPGVIGTVSWVMSYATALLIVGKFGIDLAASRLASEYGVNSPGRLRPLFGTALRLRLIFTLSVAGGSLLFSRPVALFFGDAELEGPIRVGALIVIGASLYEFKENFLIGLNRLKTVYQVRSVHLLSRVLMTSLLVFLGFGASAILLGYCASWALAISIYALLLARYLPMRDSSGPDADMSRRLLVLSGALAISSASVTIYSHMDRLMLGYFSGVEEVGQYAVARNIAEVSLFPVFAMIMMLRPALAARFASGELADCARVIRQSMRYSLVSGVLFGAIFAVLGVPLVTLVFSGQFQYAGELMVFFVGVVAFRSIGSVILPALVAAERTRVYAYLTAISAGMNFLLNLALIPRYDSRGAIVATIVSYGFLLVFGLREVFSAYGVRVRMAGVWIAFRTILAGAIAGAAVWQATRGAPLGLDAVVWAAILSVVYVFLIFVFRVGSAANLRTFVINLKKSRT